MNNQKWDQDNNSVYKHNKRMQDSCDSMNDNSASRFIYLNTSSPVDGIVWVGMSLEISKD